MKRRIDPCRQTHDHAECDDRRRQQRFAEEFELGQLAQERRWRCGRSLQPTAAVRKRPSRSGGGVS